MKKTGRIWITSEDNFCLLRARGPWNKENLKRFLRSLDSDMATPQTSQWGTLAVLYGESLMTPDAVTMFSNAHQHMAQNGLTCVAVVLNEAKATSLVKHQFSNIYQQCGLEHAFFDTEQAAIDWLQTQGININQAIMLTKPKEAFW